MADREKVLRNLEELLVFSRYNDSVGWNPSNDTETLEGALALLKEQEPRVMTLDEARNAFVIEYRSGNLKEVGMTILDLDVDPANAHYGVIYRVWTSRPTDERRGATPWG